VSIIPAMFYEHAGRTHDPLIETYLTHREQDGLEEASLTTYRSILYHAHRELPEGLTMATWDELRPWIYDPGRSQSSKKVYRSAIAGFFAWATHPAQPRLDYNPMAFSTPVRVPRRRGRPVPQDRLNTILTTARQPFRTWFVLAAGAGLRCIEISRLDRAHVDERELWVQGKGGKQATVPTHPAVWAAVRDLPSGPVARNLDGRRATRDEISERGNRHLDRLGFPDVTMHRLRHYFGTGIFRISKDITLARDGLRHGSVQTTEGYIGQEDDALARAVLALALPM